MQVAKACTPLLGSQFPHVLLLLYLYTSITSSGSKWEIQVYTMKVPQQAAGCRNHARKSFSTKLDSNLSLVLVNRNRYIYTPYYPDTYLVSLV